MNKALLLTLIGLLTATNTIRVHAGFESATSKPQTASQAGSGYISFSDDQFYVMSADGTNLRKLTNFPSHTAIGKGVWSPDRSHIALAAGGSSQGNADIFIINADGSNLTNITKSPTNEFAPTWSPDGKKIAFESCNSCYGNGADNHQIYVMNADGTDVKRLTSISTSNSSPQWSPVDNRIAYISFQKEGLASYQLHVSKADGSDSLKIMDIASSFFGYTWSPDGKKMVIGADWVIYVINSDGTDRELLLKGVASIPQWSPDGQFIAFEQGGKDFNQVYVVSADGSKLIRIEKRINDEAHLYEELSFAWSPSSRQIALSVVEEGQNDIYLADLTCVDTDKACSAVGMKNITKPNNMTRRTPFDLLSWVQMPK